MSGRGIAPRWRSLPRPRVRRRSSDYFSSYGRTRGLRSLNVANASGEGTWRSRSVRGRRLGSTPDLRCARNVLVRLNDHTPATTKTIRNTISNQATMSKPPSPRCAQPYAQLSDHDGGRARGCGSRATHAPAAVRAHSDAVDTSIGRRGPWDAGDPSGEAPWPAYEGP